MNVFNQPDPVRLEIFKNLYQFIAEQMGIVLQNTAASVNIKERLDFSCAIFDGAGSLVANAPHIPVHLGSMGSSVTSLIQDEGVKIRPGDIFLANNPYNGGTHLPDVTIISPVFLDDIQDDRPIFFVASRGHQADIGGITPGSMPPQSIHIDEEGILFDNFLLVEAGQLKIKEIQEALTNHPYPARNVEQNIADFKAQIAANNRGVQELLGMVKRYGLDCVQAYMQFVQDNAEAAVRKAIASLQGGEFCYEMDHGAKIQVKITVHNHPNRATVDFTGTSLQQTDNNFNAPVAVTKAAVLYAFRTLVEEAIPLNAGCLKPIKLVVPNGSMLNPSYPAAVVAGNVETSQTIVDSLYGALGVLAGSQGTMNNFTFGNQQYQYYETICGGSGAGPDFAGTDAVQTHMTNSRLTDPEILESRYPVILESFQIRPQSGGIGQHNGGNGVIRRLRFLEKMTAGVLANRRLIPPFGLAGGAAGKKGHSYVKRVNGTTKILASSATVQLDPGDTITIETPGGGGWGNRRS